MNHDIKRGLPNRYYDNRDDFLVERAKIFSPMWVCIGFANDVPGPGDVFPLEFMELPLLLVRDHDRRAIYWLPNLASWAILYAARITRGPTHWMGR